MTNYERNKEKIDLYVLAQKSWAVNEQNEIVHCDDINCNKCLLNGYYCCKMTWLQEEYKEPEIDWSKVKIDTPILVRNEENNEWEKRYFAGYLCGKVCTFDGGNTTKDFNFIISWNYAKLAEEDDEE